MTPKLYEYLESIPLRTLEAYLKERKACIGLEDY